MIFNPPPFGLKPRNEPVRQTSFLTQAFIQNEALCFFTVRQPPRRTMCPTLRSRTNVFSGTVLCARPVLTAALLLATRSPHSVGIYWKLANVNHDSPTLAFQRLVGTGRRPAMMCFSLARTPFPRLYRGYGRDALDVQRANGGPACLLHKAGHLKQIISRRVF